MSIHHIQLWVPDLHRAERSWGWLLSELGYQVVRRFDHGRVWRDGDGINGAGIVIEQSPDMVPGMLHSRLRPGMNHIAFRLPTADQLERLVGEAAEHGWRSLDGGVHHPLHGLPTIAYLEDHDGFEVELIGPSQDGAHIDTDEDIGRVTIDDNGKTNRNITGGDQ